MKKSPSALAKIALNKNRAFELPENILNLYFKEVEESEDEEEDEDGEFGSGYENELEINNISMSGSVDGRQESPLVKGLRSPSEKSDYSEENDKVRITEKKFF